MYSAVWHLGTLCLLYLCLPPHSLWPNADWLRVMSCLMLFNHERIWLSSLCLSELTGEAGGGRLAGKGTTSSRCGSASKSFPDSINLLTWAITTGSPCVFSGIPQPLGSLRSLLYLLPVNSRHRVLPAGPVKTFLRIASFTRFFFTCNHLHISALSCLIFKTS